jgi:hypothetical protein
MSTPSTQVSLSTDEATRLGRCEGIIKKGLETFVEVGEALLIIRDQRLYRSEFGTFEAYCSDRWGMDKRSANRLVGASEVVKNLNRTNWSHLPKSEGQARALTSLEPETQRLAWEETVNRHGDKVTGAKVADVAREYALVDEVIREAKKPISDMFVAPASPYVDAIRHGGRDAEEVGREYAEELKAKTAHVSNNSGNNEWYTPSKFIASAKAVMGDIDLDPASSEIANETVGASNIYTEEANGLENPWFGRVWMNPPYAQPLIFNFSERIAEAYDKGEIDEGIALVNNGTETSWFRAMADSASAVCFPKSRIKFYKPSGELGAPLQGQAIIYFGQNPRGFCKEFSKHGITFLSYE